MITNNNINLFNYIYNSEFENKSDNENWKEFESICKEECNIEAYDFLKKNEEYITYDNRFVSAYITGEKYVGGRFAYLNRYGQQTFRRYKISQLNNLIDFYGSSTFSHLEELFKYLNNSAKKELLFMFRENDLISFKDNEAFVIIADIVHSINYKNIKINYKEKEDNEKSTYSININGNGNSINQIGKGDNATISIKTDDQLFELIDSKIDAIKYELKAQQCDYKIEELEEKIKAKDKKSILEILSDLSSIGSFISQGLISFF